MVAFAGAGLVINGIAALLLRSHGGDLNLRSAFLHLVGDAVTSLGVMLSGLIVYLTGWSYADPIVSILVSLWIAPGGGRDRQKDGERAHGGDTGGRRVRRRRPGDARHPGVKGVHDLHIWSISSSDLALSAHVVVEDAALSELGDIKTRLKDMLAREFSVGHVTIELEDEGGQCAGSSCDIVPAGLKQNETHLGHQH